MVSFMKLVQKAKVLESLEPLRHRWLLRSSEELPLNAISVGCLPVYVGEERQRFVIPTDFLSHPLFRMLLERAYREYGFEQRSGLMLPCNVSVFQEVVSAVKCSHGQFDLEKLMEDLI
ncbi:auxin-responsive protein SAUR50-like [Phoenix dactylifera]|uniref:Auxin-responsive protein SAUR50-like n=1 Tax=Phoenix dactylifera TaxID=42345 RepID=A0A8B9ASS8_PHODC|nr:auxin-responsive protein SAUR50-like [Phoenix dactylifera]